MNINVIYEDNHILVVEKPVNIPSQKDDTNDMDMLSILKKYIKEKYSKPGEVYLGLVHRLDRPVGGIMIFARTSKAASRLSEDIRKGTFHKKYLAIVRGIFKEKKGILEDYLLKNTNRNIVLVVKEGTEGAKKAILEYEVLQQKDNLSLVKINLLTGRSHQIRVQFANMGHPLYGDQKYGRQFSKVGEQIALWSNELEIIHPTKKEKMFFKLTPTKVEPWTKFEVKN